MRQPYLLSTLDMGKDTSLFEMIKDTSLRESLVKLKEEAMAAGAKKAFTIVYKNYPMIITPMFSQECSQPPIGYMLICPNEQSNRIENIVDAIGTTMDSITLRIEEGETLESCVNKVLRLCQEQFGLSSIQVREYLQSNDNNNELIENQRVATVR